MKQVSNLVITTIIRCLPIVLENVDRNALVRNTRLQNAVRLLRYNVLKRLSQTYKKI